MTDKSKLRQIRENIPKVYDSGWEVGYDTGNAEGFSQGYVQGYDNGTAAATPKGEVELTENNKTYDVTEYASAKVNIAGIEDLSTALSEQEELVAELKGIIAQKAKLGDAKLPSVVDGTVTELTAEDLAGVTSIRNYAFQYCENIKKVTLPNGVTAIGRDSFASCTNLEAVTFPPSLHTQSYRAFNKCSKLKNANFNYFTALAESAFESCAFEELDLSNITSASNYAFRGCTNLKTVVLPNCYFKGLFSGCTALETVSFRADYKSTIIAESAFSNCQSLVNIRIPQTVKKIESYAFRKCAALQYIDLTDYGTDLDFPTLYNVNAFQSAGTSTASGTFEIRVKSGRKAELAAMTNWSTYADNIVEV